MYIYIWVPGTHFYFSPLIKEAASLTEIYEFRLIKQIETKSLKGKKKKSVVMESSCRREKKLDFLNFPSYQKTGRSQAVNERQLIHAASQSLIYKMFSHKLYKR